MCKYLMAENVEGALRKGECSCALRLLRKIGRGETVHCSICSPLSKMFGYGTKCLIFGMIQFIFMPPYGKIEGI
jgi:hypothetical protein